MQDTSVNEGCIPRTNGERMMVENLASNSDSSGDNLEKPLNEGLGDGTAAQCYQLTVI